MGFDYLGVGFEYVYFKDSGRVEYVMVIDEEVLRVFYEFFRMEGIFLVFELVYVVVYVMKIVLEMDKDEIIIVNFFGRGDKDLDIVRRVGNV